MTNEPKCADFGVTITVNTVSEPQWLKLKEMYGKEVEFVVESDPDKRSCQPLGEELNQKCKIVQWVEGMREVDGVPVEGMNNPSVYKVDFRGEDVGKLYVLT